MRQAESRRHTICSHPHLTVPTPNCKPSLNAHPHPDPYPEHDLYTEPNTTVTLMPPPNSPNSPDGRGVLGVPGRPGDCEENAARSAPSPNRPSGEF